MNTGPSRAWYALGGIFLALAPVLGVRGCSQITSHIAAMQRVVVPGEGQLHLDPGTYTVFYEWRSVVDGTEYSTNPSLSDLRCSVTSPSGAPGELSSPSGRTRYQIGSHGGRSIFKLKVGEPGVHTLRCRHGNDADEPRVVLAVGTGVGAGIVALVLGILVPLFAGLGVIGFVLARRRLARVRANPAPTPPPYPGERPS